MGLIGTHVLLIAHDFPRDDDVAFNEWYVREHMPERVALPGFNRGRRYHAIGPGRRYLAFYETDAEALSSEPYLKLVRGFDLRSRQFVPRFESASRTISLVRSSVGIGEGGIIEVIGLTPSDADWWRGNSDAFAKNLVARNGIVGAHIIEADSEILGHSQRGHLRQGDLVLPWTVLVEAIDYSALDALWRGSASISPSFDIGSPLLRSRYQLLFSIEHRR